MTGPARTARRENALTALVHIPVFRRIWAAIAVSSLGDWLGLLATTALAQQLTRHESRATQGVAIAGVLLTRLAPDLFFGVFAAALADKFDRRKIAVIGDLAAGLLYLSIAIGYNLIWLYAAQFVIEAVGLFTQPAKQVIWVSIVPKKLLATANQISLFSVYGTVPIAAILFALLSAANRLIAGHGADPANGVDVAIVIALIFDAVTFFVSSGTVFLSRRSIPAAPHARERGQSIFSLLREGVAFVRRDALIRSLYVGVIGAFAAGGLTAGVAQLWVLTLDAGTAGYSIMFGTLFTGLAIGMLIGPRVLPTFTRSRVFGLSIGGAGTTLLIMSLIRDFILADGLAALVGLFAGTAWIIGYTLIGQEVEDRLRGRIFAFVLSSVRLTLFLSLLVGPLLSGTIGTHSVPVGHQAKLTLSGPGLTLLIGGVVAIGVAFYATRSNQSPTRLRDLVRRRLINAGLGRPREEHAGVFVVVDGLDADATAGYATLLADHLRARGVVVTETSEPTDSETGRRVGSLLFAAADGGTSVEPETAALLSAADRAEHVASVIRPALVRGEVVVCDRYTLTSLAVHGGGRGADVDRIRGINLWSTGGLQPDLVLVVVDPPDLDDTGAQRSVAEGDGIWLAGAYDDTSDFDADAARTTLLTEAEGDPARYVRCAPDGSATLPPAVVDRLSRLLDTRAGTRSTAVVLADGLTSDAALAAATAVDGLAGDDLADAMDGEVRDGSPVGDDAEGSADRGLSASTRQPPSR